MTDETNNIDDRDTNGPQKVPDELEKILEEICRKPTVNLWPHAGKALGYGKGSTYAAAGRGEIDVIRFGKRYRAVSASLRKLLKLNGGQ